MEKKKKAKRGKGRERREGRRKKHKSIRTLLSCFKTFSSVQFSRSVMSDSLQPHELVSNKKQIIWRGTNHLSFVSNSLFSEDNEFAILS